VLLLDDCRFWTKVISNSLPASITITQLTSAAAAAAAVIIKDH